MVVDDNGAMRRSVRRMLEQDGHTVAEAPNGRLAMDQMGHRPAELVISDVFMPDMNGFEFLVRLREGFPGTSVIVMSGGGHVGGTPILDAAAKLGADRVFEKPFDLEEMREAVRLVLTQRDPDSGASME